MQTAASVANAGWNAASATARTLPTVAAIYTELSMKPGQFLADFAGRTIAAVFGTGYGMAKCAYDNCTLDPESTRPLRKSLSGYVVHYKRKFSDTIRHNLETPLFRNRKVTSPRGLCGLAGAGATTLWGAQWFGLSGLAALSTEIVHTPQILFKCDVTGTSSTRPDILGYSYSTDEPNSFELEY